MANDEKYRVWDSFWQNSRVYCAGLDSNPDITANFDAHWAQVAAGLPQGARVLDLACGNGCVSMAVARAARAAGKSITIDAIDAADIDPKRYLTQFAALTSQVNFRGRTLMEKLPFAPVTFDAVFSQYGIEFGLLSKAVAEVGRILKPGGTVSFLALAEGTALGADLARKVKQSRHILACTKLFEVTTAVVQAIHQFETTGTGREPAQYLQKFSAEVEGAMAKTGADDVGPLSVVVMTLQKVLTGRKSMSLAEQIAAIATLKTRLTEFVARSEAVVRSALGETTIASLTRGLSDVGVRGARPERMTDSADAMVAWRIAA